MSGYASGGVIPSDKARELFIADPGEFVVPIGFIEKVRSGVMPDRYTWHLADEPVRPFDGSWTLVADRRFDAPVKAKYHADHDYFEYDAESDDVFGSYMDDGDIRAWMPLPMFYG